jgi:hypothetical protein
MSRRVSPRGDLYRPDSPAGWQKEMVEAEREHRAGHKGLRGPIIWAVAAGLLLGAAVAVFENGPASLRLQAYDLVGIGAPRNCEEASALGIGPHRRGERYYFSHLDADGDGVSCAYVPGGGFR